MNLEATAAGQVLATKNATKALPGVRVSVEDVHLEVSLLAGADVGAVGAVPASECLHHHHVSKAVLRSKRKKESWGRCQKKIITSFLPPSLCIS